MSRTIWRGVGSLRSRSGHVAGRLVETAGVRELFHEPKHPTRGPSSAQSPRCSRRERALHHPRPAARRSKPMPGCAFAPRCEFATDRCAPSRPSSSNTAPATPTPASACKPEKSFFDHGQAALHHVFLSDYPSLDINMFALADTSKPEFYRRKQRERSQKPFSLLSPLLL